MRQIRSDHTIVNRIVYYHELLEQPATLVVIQNRHKQLRPQPRSPEYDQTRLVCDQRQQTSHRSAPLETPAWRERSQQNSLRRVFHLTSFAKDPARYAKNSRTKSSYYFREGRLVASLRLPRQVEFGGLFNPTLQMRSSTEDGGSLARSLVIYHLTFFIGHFVLLHDSYCLLHDSHTKK